jgi:aromatic-L-amino-acid decarboxylase
MERILADFRELILPGVTHWNHPRFFAYFPANNSGPSILGELLSAALGINAMLWQTCPAATELEELVLEWLRQMLDLPESFRGAIQDTASTATLCALICARERSTQFAVNGRGFAAGSEGGDLRIYTSQESHSSVDKGARIAGFGAANVVKIPVDAAFAMQPEQLEDRIRADRAAGRRPCCIVATTGTTSCTAMDPLGPLADIARRHGLWLHVDAALAGSAAILPEKRWILDGVGGADSFVFNPHKWLLTNFDCSAYFTRDKETLLQAMSVMPEYLKTDRDQEVTNYRDWSIPLGRRFRALKLWFVLRSYGVAGLQEFLREHLRLAEEFGRWIQESEDFELLAPIPVNTVCFRFHPQRGHAGAPGQQELDELNKALLDEVNASGRIYITHTRLGGRFTLRFCVGQRMSRFEHVREGWECLNSASVVQRWHGRA